MRLNHGRRFAFLHYVYRQISLLHVLPRNRHVSSKSIPEIPDVYESSHWKSVADGRFGDRIWKQIETSVAAFVDVTDDAARVWLSSFNEVVQRIRAKRKGLSEWQALVAGSLFVLMALGNFNATVMTFIRKRDYAVSEAKRRKKKEN